MRKRYKQLHDLKGKALADAGALLTLSETEGRELSVEERARFDAFHAEATKHSEEIARFDRQFAAEAGLQLDPRARIHLDPVAADPKGGFRDLADFAVAVRGACLPGGRPEARLAALYQAAPANYHQEGHTVEGYMVPPAMRQEIWELVFEADDLLALVNPEPTESNAVQFVKDETTPWGATGIVAKWRAEASQMTATKLVTQDELLRLHELYAFVTATEELLQDAPLLNSRLTRKAADAIRWKAAEAIMWGTGAGQPFGWMVAPSLITQTKEAAQLAATIVTNNVLKMYSRLWTSPGGRPMWFGNRDIVPQLAVLTIGNQPIWTGYNMGLREAPGGVLLGYPIRWTEHAHTLGTKGDLQLVDLSGYYAATKAAGVQFASSIHLFFDYGIQAFRWTFRLGGQPFLAAPVSPAKGATTKSHFVCIETRA